MTGQIPINSANSNIYRKLAPNHHTRKEKYTQVDARSMNSVPEVILALLQTTPAPAVEVASRQLTRRTRPVKIATTTLISHHPKNNKQ